MHFPKGAVHHISPNRWDARWAGEFLGILADFGDFGWMIVVSGPPPGGGRLSVGLGVFFRKKWEPSARPHPPIHLGSVMRVPGNFPLRGSAP